MRAQEFIIESAGLPNENSNGKPIAHSPEALQNFWTWFKGSKVVDSQGRPLVMYHGTGADFAKFGYEFADEGASAYGMGFYFTSAPHTASGYAAGEYPNVMPVYLNIKKPLPSNYTRLLNRAQLRKIIMMAPDLDDALTNFGDVNYMGMERLMSEVIDQFEDSADTLLGQLNTVANDFYRGANEAFLKAAMAVTKFDGVKHGFDDEVFYIAWDSRQIKSAVGNRGGYHKKKDDMVDEAFSGNPSKDVINAMKRGDEEWSNEKSVGEEDDIEQTPVPSKRYYIIVNNERLLMSKGQPKVIVGFENTKRYVSAIAKNDPNKEKYQTISWATEIGIRDGIKAGRYDPTHLESVVGEVEDKAPYVPLAKKPAPVEQPAVSQPSSSGGRFYHRVPFSQKDAAKGEGMRWDPDAKKWYHTNAEKSAKSQFPKG